VDELREKSLTSRSGKKVSVTARNGIVVKSPSRSIALDPRTPSKCDISFVSHAHIDHIHAPRDDSTVLASQETAVLAKLRGYDLQESKEEFHGVDLVDAGHILGSRAILVEDSVFYTGDFSRRDRGFLKGSPGAKCDTLIMETTYGVPRYHFRDTGEIVSKVSKIIADAFDKCRPVVMTGYALGKAQMITYLFRQWDPIYLHESIYDLNEAHIDFGVKIPRLKKYDPRNETMLERKPWIMISPSSSGRSSFMKMLKEKYGAISIAFTGWAVDQNFARMVGVDYAFDLSDHCDFPELVDLAKYSNPSKIYTVHGFAEEFAEHLRTIGFDAWPLEEKDQTTIGSFL
jgi:putative mRNA 3-end processing factor